MGRYHELMNRLNPRVIIAKVDEPHDTARGSYVLKSSIASSYAQFEKIVIHYLDHHMRHTIGGSLPPDLLLAKARAFLDSSGGFDNAVFIGLSGSEGGMVNVLNLLCDSFKQEAKKAYFDYITDQFVDPLSFSEVVEVMRGLKANLGGYSSQAFDYVEPEAMAGNYKRILWQYIDSLTRYRNLWAY